MMRALRFFLVALLVIPPALAEEAAAPQAPRVLTLDDALRTARERQPQLTEAQASTEAARARADEARAALLPQVSGTASYQRGTSNGQRLVSISNGLTVAPGTSSWSTANVWNFSASANQLVWDFGHTIRQWQASKATAEGQVYSARTTLSQVVLNVESAFFQARAQKSLVGVARETLANQERHLLQIQGFVQVGTRPEIDLAQARTDRANAQVQLVTAENNYETSKAQLNTAMGVEGPTDYEVADNALPAVEGEDLAVEGLLPEALKARPEFGTLSNQIRAQDLTIKATRGSYLPSLGVSTGFNDQGSKLNDMTWNWNVTASLTWPIFQGGLTRAQVAEAEANLKNLKGQLDALSQQVRLEVDQARLAVRAAKATLLANQEGLLNARERLRLAEGRYQTGMGDSLELSDAQLALTNAEAQRVQADFNLSTARAQLIKALGRL